MFIKSSITTYQPNWISKIYIKSFERGLYIYPFEYEGIINNKILKCESLKEIKDKDIIEMKIAKDYTIPS
jgi:hypothetical protein